MKLYRVEGGAARIGVGERVALTREQFIPLAPVSDVVDRQGDRYVVQTLADVEFEPDEVIGLVADPGEALAAVLVEVEE
jgi:hypothetical protein